MFCIPFPLPLILLPVYVYHCLLFCDLCIYIIVFCLSYQQLRPYRSMEVPSLSQPSVQQKIPPSAANGSPDGQTARPSRSFRLRNRSLNNVRLRRIFDAFDSDGNGHISVDELGRALENLGLPIPLPDLEPTIHGFFQNGADGLDFDAFAALHRSVGDQLCGYDAPATGKAEEQEEELREAFRVFDEDGDGFISAAELKSVLTRLGLANGEDVEQMICTVDKNSDGLVDFEEFKYMMTKVVTDHSS